MIEDIKAFIRCLIWHVFFQRTRPHYYGAGVTGWVASYSLFGVTLGFLEEGGGMVFRW